MNTEHVLQALKALNVWLQDHVHVVTQLGDGPTNETWLVSHQNSSNVNASRQQYVLRIVKPMAKEVGLSLTDQLPILNAAAEKGLTATVVASCPQRGLLLSEYISGRAWQADDLRLRSNLQRLAKTLRGVHSLDCSARPLNLATAADNYARRSGEANAQQHAHNIRQQLAQVSTRPSVLCHNDLNAANIIDDGELYVIDWEFAARGDPLFDLAVVIAHHQLDDAAANYLLRTYLEDTRGESLSQATADLKKWCAIYSDLLVLWQSVFSP